MRWFLGKEALETIELLVAGVLVLAFTALGVYTIVKAASQEGANARSSIEALPAPPSSWP